MGCVPKPDRNSHPQPGANSGAGGPRIHGLSDAWGRAMRRERLQPKLRPELFVTEWATWFLGERRNLSTVELCVATSSW